MSSAALYNLWSYIDSLSLSVENREWLANQLLRQTVSEEERERIKDEAFMKLSGAWANDSALENVEEIIANSRQSGVTHHVVDFDEI